MVDFWSGDHPYPCPRCSSSPTPDNKRREREIAEALERQRTTLSREVDT